MEELITASIEYLIMGSIGIAVIRSYLVANKIWSRKHERIVSESISVIAETLSLLTVLPFIVKFAILEHDPLLSFQHLLKVVMASFFLCVGIGIWVRDESAPGVWTRIKRAFKLEREEAGDLIKAFVRPASADKVLRILNQVAMIDGHLDESEKAFIRDFAKEWGIEFTIDATLAGHGTGNPVDYAMLRASVDEYLSDAPPNAQAIQLKEVLEALVKLDDKVTEEEGLILAEVSGMLMDYAGEGGGATRYEVIITPQSVEQEDAIAALLPNVAKHERSGGTAFVAGVYYAESYAEIVCKKYQSLKFFTSIFAVRGGDEGDQSARAV